MPVVDVKNLDGKTVGQVELADAVFAAKVNPHLLHETVRWYLAAQRAGTHKTKGRGEVSGSGRKLWRQKGTGRARVGSIRSSLSAKLADEKLIVVDAWALESHKTKAFRQALDKLDGDTRTMLLVDQGGNRNLELASRNLEGVKLVQPTKLQPYDLLRHDRLVISKDAAVRLGTSLGPKGGTAPTGKPAEAKPAKPAKATAKAEAAPAAEERKPRAPRPPRRMPKTKGKKDR